MWYLYCPYSLHIMLLWCAYPSASVIAICHKYECKCTVSSFEYTRFMTFQWVRVQKICISSNGKLSKSVSTSINQFSQVWVQAAVLECEYGCVLVVSLLITQSNVNNHKMTQTVTSLRKALLLVCCFNFVAIATIK